MQECAVSTLAALQFLQGLSFFILLHLKAHLQARHEIDHLVKMTQKWKKSEPVEYKNK